MNKKQFLKQIKKFRDRLDRLDYCALTCHRVNDCFSGNASRYYRRYISKFLRYEMIKSRYKEKTDQPMLLRCMPTEAFFDECLESGVYKEF